MESESNPESEPDSGPESNPKSESECEESGICEREPNRYTLNKRVNPPERPMQACSGRTFSREDVTDLTMIKTNS